MNLANLTIFCQRQSWSKKAWQKGTRKRQIWWIWQIWLYFQLAKAKLEQISSRRGYQRSAKFRESGKFGKFSKFNNILPKASLEVLPSSFPPILALAKYHQICWIHWICHFAAFMEFTASLVPFSWVNLPKFSHLTNFTNFVNICWIPHLKSSNSSIWLSSMCLAYLHKFGNLAKFGPLVIVNTVARFRQNCQNSLLSAFLDIGVKTVPSTVAQTQLAYKWE